MGWKDIIIYYGRHLLYIYGWINNLQEKTHKPLKTWAAWSFLQFFAIKCKHFSELHHIVTDIPEFILLKLRKKE